MSGSCQTLFFFVESMRLAHVNLTADLPPDRPTVRPVRSEDLDAWQRLWDGYNAFYGRHGETALPARITATTWQRFLDPEEAVYALVAVQQGHIVGLAHYLYHRSTTRIELTCYMQDLFTDESARGRGVGRALIEGVYGMSKAVGIERVYWQTHETNVAGRALYERLARHRGFIVYSHDL